MEFTHIGAHCSLPYCKQLDFLPYNCESCHKKFCGDHRKELTHQCESFKEQKAATTLKYVHITSPPPTITYSYTNSCVLCSHVLVVKPDQDPNSVVDMHIIKGDCKKQQARTINKHKCSKCGKFGMTEITCRDCGNNYCLSHRYATHLLTSSIPSPHHFFLSSFPFLFLLSFSFSLFLSLSIILLMN